MSKFKFKKNADKIETSDFWYDLTDGGYIKPHDILEKESADEVEKAIKLLMSLEKELLDKELMDYM